MLEASIKTESDNTYPEEEYEPMIKRTLPVFAQIHEQFDAEQASCDMSEDELSDIEHVSQSSDSENEKPCKFDQNSGSDLNTT